MTDRRPDYLDRAKNATNGYMRNLEEIRRNRELSENGKKRRIAELWLGHSKSMEAMREEYAAYRQERSQHLEKRLFGGTGYLSTADTMTYRDAMLKASSIERESQALELLRGAKRIGDRIFAKAIAQRASELDEHANVKWLTVLEAYAGEDQTIRADIEEYIDVTRPGGVFRDPVALEMTGGRDAHRPREISDVRDVEKFLETE